MTTNGRSKILEYLYANSPVNKATMVVDLKLAHSTLDKYMTGLRKEGYVKSDGNGYWGLTIEGRKQYEIDPMLPANQKAKDSSRVFSLSQYWDYIEHNFECRACLEHVQIKFNPELLLPLVVLWLREVGQLPINSFGPVEIDEDNPALRSIISDALDRLDNLPAE